MYYGFKNLCADFTSAHPGYTIYPVHLNGSAVETFFSQVKHATSGQLSSLNYAIARGAGAEVLEINLYVVPEN